MRVLSKVVVSTIVLLVAMGPTYAKEWRGLVPLHSTRADVMRLFNQCSDQREACRFKRDSEKVHIVFSGGLPQEYSDCAARLPPETVMLIEVEPLAKLKLANLHLDKRRLQRFDSSDPAHQEFKGYRSNGLVVSLFRNRILQVVYFADESDGQSCAAYYSRPELFVRYFIIHVPLIHQIDAPASVKAGETVKASASSYSNETRGYTWDVSAGRIIAGQYTKQVTVDTTGLAGQQIIITAEIEDVLGHAATASCVVVVSSSEGGEAGTFDGNGKKQSCKGKAPQQGGY